MILANKLTTMVQQAMLNIELNFFFYFDKATSLANWGFYSVVDITGRDLSICR